MASVGPPNGTNPNGELGSISGTIYAPHQYAIFGDDDNVSGRANLAVLTGCIRINGADEPSSTARPRVCSESARR